jgi:hypothetical protein
VPAHSGHHHTTHPCGARAPRRRSCSRCCSPAAFLCPQLWPTCLPQISVNLIGYGLDHGRCTARKRSRVGAPRPRPAALAWPGVAPRGWTLFQCGVRPPVCGVTCGPCHGMATAPGVTAGAGMGASAQHGPDAILFFSLNSSTRFHPQRDTYRLIT